MVNTTSRVVRGGGGVHTLFQILLYFQSGHVGSGTWEKVRSGLRLENTEQLHPASLSRAETLVLTPALFVTPPASWVALKDAAGAAFPLWPPSRGEAERGGKRGVGDEGRVRAPWRSDLRFPAHA